MHLLMHLPKSAMQLGPLWATSVFLFESANGTLLHLITAAKGVPLQVAERWVMKQTLMRFSEVTHLPASFGLLLHSYLKLPDIPKSDTLGIPQPVTLTAAVQDVLDHALVGCLLLRGARGQRCRGS